MKPLRVATVPAFDAIRGLVHGFERRLGPQGWETREAGRARVTAALAEKGALLLLTQVHGACIQRAPWQGCPEADAGLASEPGVLVGVETADCLPILIVDARRRVVAAVHAGWRGTAAGIAGRAVETLVADGSRRDELIAALGPGIGACCYEVGDELRESFGPSAEGLFRPGPRGKPHLDVRLANVRELEAAGLDASRLHHVAECTHCLPDLYHSFRREGTGAGRMINFVGFARGSWNEQPRRHGGTEG